MTEIDIFLSHIHIKEPLPFFLKADTACSGFYRTDIMEE
jgi:hypothetical protein